ncbi:MAG: 2-dehydropantoate 2-reductase [Burkholderiales bacterium]|jgi:2-dehydropantoate 2-reductase|nr:2-dehydropantoate 2-reductase [Burkholderiales bacterium]
MRILIIGAGAIGGYFGGRLLQAGQDVTFLVRARRALQLERSGLRIQSPRGDLTLHDPATVQAEHLRTHFDLIVLSCKAYDLDDVIRDMAPAVGPQSAILPLLNGMRHLDALDAAFGRQRVLGGQCMIAATLDADGVIVHLNDTHHLVFGERDGEHSDRARRIAEAFVSAQVDVRASSQIIHEMWEKWVFLTTLASGTCLMRAPIGAILAAPSGKAVIEGLLEACLGVSRSAGYAPRAAFLERTRDILTTAGSTLTASMLRDIENGSRIEADHIVGDMLQRRVEAGLESPGASLLSVAYSHLKAYEARRAEAAGKAA